MERSGACQWSAFLSTPSARRATEAANEALLNYRISIHALREEGDLCRGTFTYTDYLFLSTPSARRATWSCKPQRNHHAPISIHALREEGDSGRSSQYHALSCISIHALREEGDRCGVVRCQILQISIHALREEGDQSVSLRVYGAGFLSTPSARRATGRRKEVHTGKEEFLSTPSARRATCLCLTRYRNSGFLSTPSARRATRKP